MVKTAQTDAIPLLVASAARAIEDVVDLEIAARGTPGRRAAPAVAHQDRIVGDVVGALVRVPGRARRRRPRRSEEHTSELQSLTNLVCRLLLEKKKKKKKNNKNSTQHYPTKTRTP